MASQKGSIISLDARPSLPGIFAETIFTPKKSASLKKSFFIRPIHPKTAILPTPEAILKFLGAGWVGQLKIHGHRAQIHISSDPKEEILVYNRHGRLHKKALTGSMKKELRRVFLPKSGWNVIDAEWLKPEERLFVFDFLRKEDILLRKLSYLERWKLLPRAFISPHIQTLSVISTLEACLEALKNKSDSIEGLVFKSASPGFEDSSIVRCRKRIDSRT
ncbi:MAG: hypothetical protein HYX41_03495 [Bdellovibrio sp.]|nr:hypothetical protein [Bdellovibrio sp.]